MTLHEWHHPLTGNLVQICESGGNCSTTVYVTVVNVTIFANLTAI